MVVSAASSDAYRRRIMWESLTDTLRVLATAHKYGSAGVYGALQRIFVGLGVICGGASFLMDAPFGRFISTDKASFMVDGNIGWLLMEIVSPLAFVLAFSTPISTGPLKSVSLYLAGFSTTNVRPAFLHLPRARVLLALMYLAHYTNRSIVSTLRNPKRSQMHVSVPLSAMFFNLINGTLMGMYVAGGQHTLKATHQNWGVSPGYLPLYGLGIIMWALGFASNIACDEMLYSLKRKNQLKTISSQQRYGIPTGFLYDRPFGGVSHPSYSSEWLEWAGFLLATMALVPPIFTAAPPSMLAKVLSGLNITPFADFPDALLPLRGWYLQPPALFLWNLIAVMLPRAISGHKWYANTFGKEWPKERNIVIPGIY